MFDACGEATATFDPNTRSPRIPPWGPIESSSSYALFPLPGSDEQRKFIVAAWLTDTNHLFWEVWHQQHVVGILGLTRIVPGLDALAHFHRADAGRRLPFAANSVDAVLSNDAMCHVPRRESVLREWFRVLKPGGRILFTDAMVITGLLSNDEIATRTSIGSYFFLPPGENERLIRASGFELVRTDDVTANAAIVAKRWHDARARRGRDLIRIEGQANFEGLQKFLWHVHVVSAEGRLSRYAYLARKPKVARATSSRRASERKRRKTARHK